MHGSALAERRYIYGFLSDVRYKPCPEYPRANSLHDDDDDGVRHVRRSWRKYAMRQVPIGRLLRPRLSNSRVTGTQGRLHAVCA